MESVIDTTSYMIGGYAVIFGLMLLYGISLLVRWRNLRQDEELLKKMAKKED